MPDKLEHGPRPDHSLDEEMKRVEEHLRELHRQKEQRHAQEFSGSLEKEGHAAVRERQASQDSRFSNIPGITRPENPPTEAMHETEGAQAPVAELNASMKRGEEAEAKKIVDGKISAHPSEMNSIAERLMETSQEE